MHPALAQQIALERAAAFHAAAHARRQSQQGSRRPLIIRAARRALRPAHA